MKRFLALAAFLLITLTSLPAAETVIYKQAGDKGLKLFIDKPADWKAADKRPAIVFYFGGGSAGGHLAAFTGLVDGIDDPKDDLTVSCKPQALVLFNPVFNNGPGQWGHERVGDDYLKYSPAHHVTKEAPPTIVFLGDMDKLIPVAVLNDFAAQMKQAGVRCDPHVYPKVGHGFFNRDPHKTLTLIETDKFLTSLGWLHGEPTLKVPY